MRTWSGIIAFENVETGDGRVFVPGCFTWERPADVMLEWNVDDQASHEGIGVFGYATAIVREGNAIRATGVFDDTTDDGQLLAAKLDAGTAGGVSIVFDDAALEVVDRSGDGGDMMLLLASASRFVVDDQGVRPVGHMGPAQVLFGDALTAAAGDEVDDDGDVVYEDAQDLMLQRFTRARIRSVTLVSIPAFIDARISLDAAGTDVVVDDVDDEAEPVAAAAAVAAHVVDLDRPPYAMFTMPEPDDDSGLYVEQANGGVAVPLTITDDGHVFGHACYWGQCHIGYSQFCVEPPVSDEGWMRAQPALLTDGMRHTFHTGTVPCHDGSSIGTAPVVLDADHPDLRLFHQAAFDAYAHTGLAWCDVHVTQGRHGVWCSGALRSTVTPAQLRALRASALSGDWRPVPGFDGPQLVAILTVSRPGFPIARAASARPVVELAASGQPAALRHVNVVGDCPHCAELLEGPALVTADEFRRFARMMELRTRHLRPDAARALAASALRTTVQYDAQLENRDSAAALLVTSNGDS